MALTLTQTMIETEELIRTFVAEGAEGVLKLPKDLSADDRRDARLFAESLGLVAQSFGVGRDRCLHILKRPGSTRNSNPRKKKIFVETADGSEGRKNSRENSQYKSNSTSSPETPVNNGKKKPFRIKNTFIHIEAIESSFKENEHNGPLTMPAALLQERMRAQGNILESTAGSVMSTEMASVLSKVSKLNTATPSSRTRGNFFFDTGDFTGLEQDTIVGEDIKDQRALATGMTATAPAFVPSTISEEDSLNSSAKKPGKFGVSNENKSPLLIGQSESNMSGFQDSGNIDIFGNSTSPAECLYLENVGSTYQPVSGLMKNDFYLGQLVQLKDVIAPYCDQVGTVQNISFQNNAVSYHVTVQVYDPAEHAFGLDDEANAPSPTEELPFKNLIVPQGNLRPLVGHLPSPQTSFALGVSEGNRVSGSGVSGAGSGVNFNAFNPKPSPLMSSLAPSPNMSMALPEWLPNNTSFQGTPNATFAQAGSAGGFNVSPQNDVFRGNFGTGAVESSLNSTTFGNSNFQNTNPSFQHNTNSNNGSMRGDNSLAEANDLFKKEEANAYMKGFLGFLKNGAKQPMPGSPLNKVDIETEQILFRKQQAEPAKSRIDIIDDLCAQDFNDEHHPFHSLMGELYYVNKRSTAFGQMASPSSSGENMLSFLGRLSANSNANDQNAPTISFGNANTASKPGDDTILERNTPPAVLALEQLISAPGTLEVNRKVSLPPKKKSSMYDSFSPMKKGDLIRMQREAERQRESGTGGTSGEHSQPLQPSVPAPLSLSELMGGENNLNPNVASSGGRSGGGFNRNNYSPKSTPKSKSGFNSPKNHPLGSPKTSLSKTSNSAYYSSYQSGSSSHANVSVLPSRDNSSRNIYAALNGVEDRPPRLTPTTSFQ